MGHIGVGWSSALRSRVTVTAVLPLLGAVLSGCGTMPSSVTFPTATPSADGSTNSHEGRYKVGKKAINDPDLPGVLLTEKSIDAVQAQVKAHYIAWNSEASSLRKSIDGWGNTTFAGAVIGAGGALASSVDWTRAGAGIAGASGIWQSRYKFEIQAANYRLAASAMQCFRTELDKINRSTWELLYGSGGELRLTLADYQAQNPDSKDVVQGYGTLRGIWTSVNRHLAVVRDGLQNKQETTALGTPSTQDIVAALTAASQQEPKAKTQADAMVAGAEKAATDSTALLAKQTKDLEDNRGKKGVGDTFASSGGKSPFKAPSPADAAKPTAQELQEKRLWDEVTRATAAQSKQASSVLEVQEERLKNLSNRTIEKNKAAGLTPQDYQDILTLDAKLNTCAASMGK